MQRPYLTIRFDTKAQKEKFMRAAEARHWSLNRFLLVAAEHVAKMPVGQLSDEFIRQLKVQAQGEAEAL